MKNKFTLSDLIEHLEKLGYSNQEIDEFIDLMVLEVKDFKRWNKLDKESKFLIFSFVNLIIEYFQL